jgi:hypothetical protein
MKEDVLEQIVEDWLQLQGYFTIHNVPFKPSKERPDYVSNQDSVASDIDVIGFNPLREGIDRVVAVSCKSWQSGFDATAKLAELRGDKKNPKRETWRHFREVWAPKWSEAFVEAIETRTGQREFTYRVAVTKLRGDRNAWGKDETITANLPGCDVGFVTFEEMWRAVNEPDETGSTKPAPSEIGRLAQLMRASGVLDSD